MVACHLLFHLFFGGKMLRVNISLSNKHRQTDVNRNSTGVTVALMKSVNILNS